MKKALLYLCAFALMVGLFVSCEHPAAEAIVNQLVVDKDVQSPWGHAWFAGDAEYQFIDDNGTKYIRCLPDSLTDTYFIQVKSEDPESGTVEALVKYSRDSIRETGTPVKFTCSMTGYNLNFTADSSTLEKYKNLFTKTGLVSYKGVNVAKPKLPAVKTEYFSSLAGNYDLSEAEVSGMQFNVGAKVQIKKSDSEYWFASVVDIKENNNVYDFLLVHESNMDPGVTGDNSKEPFRVSQNTFWNFMKISPAESGKSKVEWSSKWSDTPYEALNGTLDQSGIFDKEIKLQEVKYSFYFGQMDDCKDNKTAFEANLGDAITTYVYRGVSAPSMTWAQLFTAAGLDSKIAGKIPDGKKAGKKWYHTGAFGLNAYNYISDSNPVLSVTTNIYIEVEDKGPAGGIPLGTYKLTLDNGTTYTFKAESSKLSYEGKEYLIKGISSNLSPSTTYQRYIYLVNVSGEGNYLFDVWYYTPADKKPYVKFKTPKNIYPNETVPEASSGYVASKFSKELPLVE
ncbi:hypothetical protein [Treponema sp.]|uniref:hypothetical protein n=1 Tax=Treponema sp. TaxID=166 RepID=UPI00298DF840|nr:hypothetical protein [Treponema sp.]